MNHVKQAKRDNLTKKEIDKKMVDLNTRLLSAKNEFYRVLIYLEIKMIMECEAVHWATIIESLQEGDDDKKLNLIEEAQNQIAGLDAFLMKVQMQLDLETPQALLIQQAMINSHELQAPKIVVPAV